MKPSFAAALFALAVCVPSTTRAQAAPPPAPDFSPIAFVVGSCWAGAFPGGAATDEHCFEWMYDRRFIRDRHAVRDKTGAIVYQGETVYGWNPLTKRIEYRYWSAEGLMLDGAVERSGDALLFPGRYPSADGTHELRATWTRVGNDSYRAVNAEKTANGEWRNTGDVVYRRKE